MSDENLAAVDLGSNSFHMVVARQVEGSLHVIDKLKERVALAEGLGKDRKLGDEAIDRGIACLERFGQRIKHLPHGNVRVVGTNTLRQAKNGEDFMERAAEVLGHEVEIISGLEEARLVYSGVAHSEQMVEGRRLVVDIGGGSTECVIGEGYDVVGADSLFMGCISFTQRFFGDGKVSTKRMNRAITASRAEMRSVVKRFKQLGWVRALGSSGTNLAIERILVDNGKAKGGITLDGLTWLQGKLVDAGRIDKISIEGLESDRRPVIVGGVAVLSGIFESLGIELMMGSSGALREGLLHDLLGRREHQDVRERTVVRLMERFAVDQLHAQRVEATAVELLDQVAASWELDEEARRMLAWAARLHEIGLFMQYSGYHKHGQYLVENSDMPGFSRREQDVLALLVRAHRRKLKRGWFKPLGPRKDDVFRLAVLLRLATLVNRGRQEGGAPPAVLKAKSRCLGVELPDGWLEESPMTRNDLEDEQGRLADADFTLELV